MLTCMAYRPVPNTILFHLKPHEQSLYHSYLHCHKDLLTFDTLSILFLYIFQTPPLNQFHRLLNYIIRYSHTMTSLLWYQFSVCINYELTVYQVSTLTNQSALQNLLNQSIWQLRLIGANGNGFIRYSAKRALRQTVSENPL